MQKLIINADDFGVSKAVNAGILQAHENNIVTSTCIMSNGKQFDDAINKLPQSLDLGIHLNLSWGKALTTGKKLDKHTQYKLLIKKGNKSFIERELRAQIGKVLDLGIKPSHLNSHQHIHAFSPVKEITIKLAKEYNINKIRWPKENSKGFAANLHYVKQKLIKFNLSKCPLTTTDNFFGLIYSGYPSMKAFLSYLNFKGTAEIMCHPAQESLSYRNKFEQSRPKELKILCSEQFSNAIKERDIKLITFKDL